LAFPILFEILCAVLVIVNGGAFLLFASDKRRAGAGAWRVSECTLLCSAALGPFGAFAAMRLFRHKTRKMKFLLVAVFLCIQVVGLIWFFASRF
jgi:uncharacterized membrane protein YsdA (DUF1294 family)